MNRTLICTLVAITSGCFGFWMGGQFDAAVQRRTCQSSLSSAIPCPTQVTRRSFWYSSLGTGLASATLAAGLVGVVFKQRDRQNLGSSPSEPNLPLNTASFHATEISLTTSQDDVLRCLLALLATQDASEDVASSLNTAISAQSSTETHQYLLTLGFSEGTIAQAWKMLQNIQEEASDVVD
jgi:hypothetical protein